VPIIEAIILGLTQGLAEFLPISSSGHLALVPWLFGWDTFQGDPGLQKSFDVALHIGTLVAVIAYFRKDIVRLVTSGLRAITDAEVRATPDGRMGWLLVLSALPAAAVGAVFADTIEQDLGTPVLIAVQLIGFGLLLWYADTRFKGHRTIEHYTAKDALKVGAFQVLSLSPGVSRSGSTMTMARFIGFDRDAAARISFLMSLPVTGGAIVFKMVDFVQQGIGDLAVPLAVGIVTSGVSGWIAVWGTIKLVRTRSFTPFVIYRCALGVAVLIIAATGLR
jgi:undecaprenyl-diphosphatase